MKRATVPTNPNLRDPNLRAVNVVIDLQLWTAFRMQAVGERRSVSRVVEDALRQYLKTNQVAGVLVRRRK